MAPDHRLLQLFERYNTADIVLVEWEIELFARLGYPRVSNGDFVFLVPDDQISLATNLAADLGYYPADHQTLRPNYSCEFSDCSIRFAMDHIPSRNKYNTYRNKLVLVPLSWSGISRHEIVRLDASEVSLPCPIYTVPISSACAAFVRIGSREKLGSRLRHSILGELCVVIGYRYFDMSYEGDYMVHPPDDQPWSEKEAREMDNAVKVIEGWNMKDDEEWIKREIIRALTGHIQWEDIFVPEDSVKLERS